MQTWAKRGMQAALVTGGMLMLGSSVTSAAECCPDRPSSPLGGSIGVPVHIDNNALGTPFGRFDGPAVDKEIAIGTDGATRRLPGGLGGPVNQAQAQAAGTVNPLLAEATRINPLRKRLPTDVGGLHGTQGRLDLLAPVDVSGNALALGGPATVRNDSSRVHTIGAGPNTDGGHSFLGGNVVAANWLLPVQATGNAIGVGGDATSHNRSEMDVRTVGGVRTDGSHGVLAGNGVISNLATPVQGTGNAIGVGGRGSSRNTSSVSAVAGDDQYSDGHGGVLAGNLIGGGAGTAGEVNGNALGLLGAGESRSATGAYSRANGTTSTNGRDALLSGNAARPAVAGPVGLNGTAGDVLGSAESMGMTHSRNVAGDGMIKTDGRDGLGGGNIVDAPVAFPILGFANGAGIGGRSTSAHVNRVESTAGDEVYTNGDGGVLGGNIGTLPVAGPADAFGNGLGVAGTARAVGHNSADVKSGGYTGTRGFDSLGGGNILGGPIANPVQGFGNGLGALGAGYGTAVNDKHSRAGGELSCVDDVGIGACNVGGFSVANPIELFGNAGGVLGTGAGRADGATNAVAGNDLTATGEGGVGAGNVINPAVGRVTQGFGNAASVLGDAEAYGGAHTGSTSGGGVRSDGHDGLASGNVGQLPLGGVDQLFGNAAAIGGRASGRGGSAADATAGGPVRSAGHGGLLTGNAASTPINPISQGFGNAAGLLGGTADAAGAGDVSSVAGGAVRTDGATGLLAGNVAHTPLSPAMWAFGDSGAGLDGTARAIGGGTTDQRTGGDVFTNGMAGLLSGNIADTPVGGAAGVFGNAGTVLGGDARGMAGNELRQRVGGTATTDAAHGILGGNVAAVAPAVLAQGFGNAGTVLGGGADAIGGNSTRQRVGGEVFTDGAWGLLSGNVGSVVQGVAAQGFGNTLEPLGGDATALAGNDTAQRSGGDILTNGTRGVLSGNIGEAVLPLAHQAAGPGAVNNRFSQRLAGGHHTEGGVLSGMNRRLDPTGGSTPGVEHTLRGELPMTHRGGSRPGEMSMTGPLDSTDLPMFDQVGTLSKVGELPLTNAGRGEPELGGLGHVGMGVLPIPAALPTGVTPPDVRTGHLPVAMP